MGCGVVNVDLRAALEVDAEVQTLDGDREDAEHDGDGGEREPDPAPLAADDVDPLPARDLLGGARP